MPKKTAERDNTCDIQYLCKVVLPKLRETKDKDSYNRELKKFLYLIDYDINFDRLLFSNNMLLNILEELHKCDLKFNKEENIYFIDKSINKNITIKKKKRNYGLYFRRMKKNSSSTSCNKHDLIYSPQEKLMLYILISNYLETKNSKSMYILENYSYINIKDIHKMFGNRSKITKGKQEEYSDIIKSFLNEDISIYISNEESSDITRNYNKWLEDVIPLENYDGSLKGFFYRFGILGQELLPITNYPSIVINVKSLCIDPRDLKKFEIARYLMINKKDPISLFNLMNDLYFYDKQETYFSYLMKLTNPNDSKFLSRFLKTIYTIVKQLYEPYDFQLEFRGQIITKEKDLVEIEKDSLKHAIIKSESK